MEYRNGHKKPFYILESDEKIIELLQKLHPKKYEAFILYYSGNYPSYGQISKHLEIPVGTVKSRLSRARSFIESYRPVEEVEV